MEKYNDNAMDLSPQTIKKNNDMESIGQKWITLTQTYLDEQNNAPNDQERTAGSKLVKIYEGQVSAPS